MTAPPAPYLIPGTRIVLEPGTPGVSHGSGWLGSQIRRAELGMSHGDHEASWAGHAFRYVGWHRLKPGGPLEPCIAEAEWPVVKLSPVTAHADALWAVGQPYTPAQRGDAVAATLALLGMHYDPLVYAWFLASAAGLAVSRDLGPMFTNPKWIICSGVVAVTDRRAGVSQAGLDTAATDDPNVVSPADLLRWWLNCGQAQPAAARPAGWLHKPVPAW